MESTDKELEEYLNAQQREGKEETFLDKMVVYRACARQVKSWLREYRELLPRKEEKMFRTVFVYSPRDPVFNVITGIKGFRSVYEKIYDDELRESEIFVKLIDLARGRITCTYLGQVEFLREHLIKEYLVKIKGCELHNSNGEKDYITVAKEDGYRSFHVYLDVPVSTLGFSGIIPFELQLRTELQDTWATRIHTLTYKNRRLKTAFADAVLQIDGKILEVSGMLYAVDGEFDAIRQEVIKAIPDD